MASLYEINADIINAMERAELEAMENEGFIEDATIDALEHLEMEREEKIDNTVLFLKNLDAESKSIKAEEANLKNRRVSVENKSKRLKEWLQFNLNGETRSTGAYKLSYRKSVAVKIKDELLIPSDYTTEVVSLKVDKMAIKKAIKAGEVVTGAELTENINLNIK